MYFEGVFLFSEDSVLQFEEIELVGAQLRLVMGFDLGEHSQAVLGVLVLVVHG
jgi:hypothetical protein